MHQIILITFFACAGITATLIASMILSFPLLIMVLAWKQPDYYKKIGAPSFLYVPYGMPIDPTAVRFRKMLDKGIPIGFPKGHLYLNLANVYKRTSLYAIIGMLVTFPFAIIMFFTGYLN